MKINTLSKKAFIKFVYENKHEFMEKVNSPELFRVENFFDKDDILALRNNAFSWGMNTEPSWHPLQDNCPDYHRLHDNYPNAYVKSKMHAFYYHGWKEENTKLFNFFKEIFEIKQFLAGYPKDTNLIKNIPSNKQVCRVHIHNYPKGGGYQKEHIDPVAKFALIQTLVPASQVKHDYNTGGLYVRKAIGSDKFYVDQFIKPGDLIILSPGIPHAVDQVDLDENYNWQLNTGRWTIFPIIINSDYVKGESSAKPREVAK